MLSCKFICKVFCCVSFINDYSFWSSRTKIHIYKQERIPFFLFFRLIILLNLLLIWWLFLFLIFINLFLWFSFFLNWSLILLLNLFSLFLLVNHFRLWLRLLFDFLLFHFLDNFWFLCPSKLLLSLSICSASSFLRRRTFSLFELFRMLIDFWLESRLFIFKLLYFLRLEVMNLVH